MKTFINMLVGNEFTVVPCRYPELDSVLETVDVEGKMLSPEAVYDKESSTVLIVTSSS